jgi:hypothetical protein
MRRTPEPDVVAGHGGPDRHVLAGEIGELLAEVLWHLESDRDGVVGDPVDLTDRQQPQFTPAVGGGRDSRHHRDLK